MSQSLKVKSSNLLNINNVRGIQTKILRPILFFSHFSFLWVLNKLINQAIIQKWNWFAYLRYALRNCSGQGLNSVLLMAWKKISINKGLNVVFILLGYLKVGKKDSYVNPVFTDGCGILKHHNLVKPHIGWWKCSTPIVLMTLIKTLDCVIVTPVS